MISNKIDDYRVLSILGTEGNCTYYKVQDRVSGIFYLWQANHYNLEADLNNALITEILTRKGVDHKNFLKVFDYIYHSGTKTVYIITEYCSYGSLSKILQNCSKNRQYINEPLIWNVLYTISNLIKENMCQIDDICLNNIFVDASNHVIKLLNLRLPGENMLANYASKDEICPIEQLGSIIYRLCRLDCSEKIKIDFVNIPRYYSKELYSVIEFLLHKAEIQPTIDAILCHPTILINLSNSDRQIYVNLSANEENNPEISAENVHKLVDELKIRETNVKLKESKIEEREKFLKKRERKIVLAERLAKEKLRRAELYLKSSKSNNDALSERCTKDLSLNIYENVSVIKKQKSRANTNVTKRRVHSLENKIRFKGHSPLKDIQNCPQQSQTGRDRNSKKKVSINSAESTDWTSETNSDKTVVRSAKIASKPDFLRRNTNSKSKDTNKTDLYSTVHHQAIAIQKSPAEFAAARRNTTARRSFLNIMFSRTAGAKKKSKEDEWKENDCFRPASVQLYEEIGDFQEEDIVKTCKTEIPGCKALIWTEENKKQAFDMLRVINEDNEDINGIKHTYL